MMHGVMVATWWLFTEIWPLNTYVLHQLGLTGHSLQWWSALAAWWSSGSWACMELWLLYRFECTQHLCTPPTLILNSMRFLHRTRPISASDHDGHHIQWQPVPTCFLSETCKESLYWTWRTQINGKPDWDIAPIIFRRPTKTGTEINITATIKHIFTTLKSADLLLTALALDHQAFFQLNNDAFPTTEDKVKLFFLVHPDPTIRPTRINSQLGVSWKPPNQWQTSRKPNWITPNSFLG